MNAIRGLVLRAAALVAVYAVCHIAGLRDYTSIICGTEPPPGSPAWLMILGPVYIAAYLGFTVVAPILLIAAALLAAARRVGGNFQGLEK